MTTTNIDTTRSELEQLTGVSQVYVDGDRSEAILRAIVEFDAVTEMEAAVDASDRIQADIETMQNVGIGVEVTMK